MYEIDKIDLDIVNLLFEDGRMPASEIARRLENVTERIVRYRIHRMVEEGLVRVSAVVNPSILGFSTVADIWLEVEADSILDVAEKVTKFECVSYVACAIGKTDISVQIFAKDTEAAYRFVTNTLGKIPGIRKTTTTIVPMILKDIYQWRIPSNLGLNE